MLKYYRSIRFRIMQISIVFTLVLSLILGYASYSIFAQMELRSSVQSTEFNLHLITSLVSQHTANLETLASLCLTEPGVIAYLSASKPTAKQALDAYEKLNRIYSNNVSAGYIQRLILTDGEDRLIQLGSPQINSVPLNRYNIRQFPYIVNSDDTSWQYIIQDPLTASFSASIPLVHPVYNRSQNICGKLFISVSTEVITGQLVNYHLKSNDLLYLNINQQNYRISGGVLTPDETGYMPIKALPDIARDSNTLVTKCRDDEGTKYIIVSSPVGSTGITISHYLNQKYLKVPRKLLILSLLVEFIVLQILGFTVYFVLKHLIMKPVNRLQERLSAIAAGDFTQDTSVEWENELGNIGRGINQLSRNVQNMMAARIADEKERQHLKYRMLQSQISPHFIYNALNSIKWMATIQKADGIAEMTASLSHLLKYLSKSTEDLIPLREELSLLHDYCIIQRYRYGNGITWKIEDRYNSVILDCLIPPFTLQPLMENAIFHGIEPNGGIGHIQLYLISETDSDFSLCVSDDGIGMSPETVNSIFSKTEGSSEEKFLHTGILNVHRRIQYAFGPDYGIKVESSSGKGTCITVHIPKHLTIKEVTHP